jgi:hypothetical protein
MDNDELIIDILKDFKLYNNIDNDDKNDIFKLYIKKAIQSILNLTNRCEFPDELKYVVLDMVNDFYLTNVSQLNLANEDSNYVKQISEEGRSVTFGNMTELALNSLLSNDIANKLEMCKKEINKYKLLYKDRRQIPLSDSKFYLMAEGDINGQS